MEGKHKAEIVFTIFISTFFIFSSAQKETPVSDISVVELLNGNSSTCRELNFKSLDAFYFCSFVLITDITGSLKENTTIFVLSDANNIIKVKYKQMSSIIIEHNEITKEYLKGLGLEDEKWMRLCLLKHNNSEIELKINYQSPKKFPLPELEVDVEKESNPTESLSTFDFETFLNDSSIPKNENATICIRIEKHIDTMPLKVAVAGLSITNQPPLQHSLDSEKGLNECSESLEKYQTLDFNDEGWDSFDINVTSLSAQDLCLDTYVISFINQSAFYQEQFMICQNLKGRFLTVHEIKYFSHYFKKFWDEVGSKVETDFPLGFLLPGGHLEAKTLKSSCSFIKLPIRNPDKLADEIDSIPCIVDFRYNFCISPSLSDFTLYGALVKYDTNYFLRASSSYSFELSGDEGSLITKRDNKWILESLLHQETCEMNAKLPVGRNKWKINDENFKILTFTHCKRNEFACTSGECLPWDKRCNGVVDCVGSDESDEETCVPVKKEKGYDVNMVPLPRKRKDSVFKLIYSTVIFNIADITSEIGIAVVDVMISLSWYDPRLTFWNPVGQQNINCKEIWFPSLSMADAARSGFQIKFESYRSFCQIFKSGDEKQINRKYSNKNPYMGTFVKGSEMKISYIFSGLVTVPCRFNLRKYPFGTQTCNITFWADNAYLASTAYEFVYDYSDRYKNYTQYEGRTELGEFHVIGADHVIERNTFVTLVIRLQNLYAYHMLNSFTPSILICIITYATLFFPITDHSDRIMVSLTALLVLAALFTQASDKSVMTPYYKLLDIWFVVKISFCFLLVAYNILLHKFKSVAEKKAKKLLKENGEENDRDWSTDDEIAPQWKKKVVRFNSFAILFFSFFYIIFIFFFCLAASDII